MTACGAKTRSGGQCQQPAGWGTQHVGQGRCKLHGGNAGAPIITGRYSIKRTELARKAQTFNNDAALGDLTGELALMRALLQDYLDRFEDGIPLPLEDIERIFGMIEAIGRLVERIAKILAATALTQAEVQYLQARIADLLNIYVPDAASRTKFLSELAESIEGNTRHSQAVYIDGVVRP